MGLLGIWAMDVGQSGCENKTFWRQKAYDISSRSTPERGGKKTSMFAILRNLPTCILD